MKIVLTNTETGDKEEFEPVDAREILATPGTIYEPDDEARKLIGQAFDPRSQDINVPQLHGDNAELQTGLSIEKYGRAAVVKAVPDGATATAMRPLTTTGRPLSLQEAYDAPAPADTTAAAARTASSAALASEGLTVPELRAALDAKDVAYPTDAKKAELAELLDKA